MARIWIMVANSGEVYTILPITWHPWKPWVRLHNASPNLLKDLEFFEDLRNAIGVSIWQDLCTTGTSPITRFSYTAVFIRPKTTKQILSNSYFSEKREEYWNFCQKNFLSFFFLNVHFNISINCKIIILLSYVSFYSLLV